MRSPVSYLKHGLNPTMPVLPLGVSRQFRAVACVLLGASPNKFPIRFQVTTVPLNTADSICVNSKQRNSL